MSEWEIDGREVSSNSLWRVIEDFENGVLSEAGREELLQVLDDSPRARAIYLEYFELAALLQIKAATQDEEGTLPVLSDRRRQRKVLRLSVLAAAAVITLLSVLAGLVALKQPEPRQVALAAVKGSAWSISRDDEGPAPEPGVVVEGAVLEVLSGTVMLELESGTRYVVQGPAKVRFPKLEAPVVERGWLWADTDGEGGELSVRTKALRFRDIGTRFGVRMRDDRRAELHVIEGIVEVQARNTGKTSKVLAGTAGFVIAEDGGMEDMALAVDPFPGLPALLESRAMYATTVLGQAPSGFWRMNESEVGRMMNAVPGGSTGHYAQRVKPAVPGVRPGAGFHGFEESNRGVYLPGDDVQSLLYDLDSPAGVSPKEGAVAFWFRRDPDLDAAEVLWYAGVPEGGGLGPQDEMHAFLSDSGRVQFFMEAGKKDVLLSSPRSFTDGQWHHVVASWSRRAVVLYVDGRLAARDEEFRPARGDNLSGVNVRFGKTGAAYSTEARDLDYFRGWVDEISLWSRGITEMEVKLQYRAAVGGGASDEESQGGLGR